MEAFIITLLKQGSIAFLGCKMTKVLNQKEISELLAASGLAVVGLSGVEMLIPVIKGVEVFFDKVGEVGEKLSWIKHLV